MKERLANCLCFAVSCCVCLCLLAHLLTFGPHVREACVAFSAADCLLFTVRSRRSDFLLISVSAITDCDRERDPIVLI